MEKNDVKRLKRVVVTGPESTGKTYISDYLAKRFNAIWIPEYARYYISNLKDKYGYQDIENIARQQISDYHRYTDIPESMVIFDTWLIITKVWFKVVFQKYPVWLDEQIEKLPIDLFLLCAPDIPWEPDDIRENGGEMRKVLFHLYEKEIIVTGVPYVVIKGTGEERNENAVKALINNLKKD